MISRIYVSIKENSLNTNILFYISSIFEFTNMIIVIDIIFNYKREFKNIYYFIYYISPIFYFEIFNCKITPKDNPEEVNSDRYKYDQIYKLGVDEFKITPIEQKDFYNYKLIEIIIIFYIIFAFSVHLLSSEKCINKILKKICFYSIYYIYITFYHVFILIFNRPIYLQFSDNYYDIDTSFISLVFLSIIYNITVFYFYTIFIYCFGRNETYYFLESKLFLCEFALGEIGCFLLVIRLKIQFSILFQLMWSIIFIYDFKIRAEYFKNELHKSTHQRILFFMKVLTFSIFIVRFISVCLIKYLIENEKIFKILEGVLFLLFVIILYFYLNKNKKCQNLSSIKNYLQKGDCKFFIGANQLFSPLMKFFSMRTNTNRILEKYKEQFFENYKDDLKNYFCLSNEDYKVLSNGNDSLISSFISVDLKQNGRNTTTTNTTTINYEKKEYNIILNILIDLFNHFYSISKEKNDTFGKMTREILIYNKVLLFFISDDKTFRAVYYLKKFIYSKKYDNSDLLINSIFKYLSYLFKKIEKKNDENSLEYLIYFNTLNIEYLKIVKCFKQILKSFNKSRKEIIRIIDTQSELIGNALDKIIALMEKSSDSIKIREQPENDKFKLIEDIMFNANFDKSFEFFDLNSLDTIVDKNNYFLIKFQKGNFIVKKAPLTYSELTSIKTSKLIDNPSINIFPYLMRKSEGKYIKSNLLNNKTIKEETVLETSEHYLATVKLNYNLLPSFNGKLYVVCIIETLNFPNDSNYILMQSNGVCIQYGIFFRNYLGFNSQLKRLNILIIFGIKDFDVKKAYNQSFSINMSEMLLNVKAHLVKDSGCQHNEITSILKKIKENFKNSKIIKVEFVLKKIYKIKNDEIYLMQILFTDLKLSIIQQKKLEIDSLGSAYIQNPINGTSITASHSGPSILSYKILRESAWNITNKKKENMSIARTAIDRISFVYNLFLIILAILICFLIKIFSTIFYNEYIKMLVIREMNISYFNNLFFAVNMIKLPNSDEIYDILNQYYEGEIEGYNISLGDYYKYLLETNAVLLSTKNKYFKNNYTNIKKNSKTYKSLYENNFNIILHDGNIQNVNYYEAFDLPKNYFYILSQIDGFYMEMPIINYNDVPSSINKLNENQQFLLCTAFNFFILITQLNSVLVVSKKRFKDAYNNYRILMYVFFLGFLIFNLFSIFLLYLSIEITNRKLYNIANGIIKLTKRGKNYLEEKLKYIKLIIFNEIKCSHALDKLKEINPNNKVKQSSLKNQVLLNSTDQEHEINSTREDNDEEDMYLVRFNTNNKKSNYIFKAYFETIRTLILLGMIYIIFLLIGFPIISNYYKKINIKRKETETVQDLQEIILGYYLESRLSIYLNDTDLVNDIDVFGFALNSLFNNYTETKKLLTKENIQSTIDYMNMVNNDGYEGCEKILPYDKYHFSLVSICKIEPLLQTKVETMISGFVNQIRSEFLSFNTSDRSSEDSMYYFHSKTFQFNNLLLIIYFKNYLQDLEYSYILPQLQNNINGLLNFLIIIFIIMVITEIMYYIGSNIFILRKISYALNDFKVLEKFFKYEDTKK